MPTLLVTDLEGECKRIEAAEDQSLMEALREAGYDEIEAICGGSCSCATCHVYVAPHASEDIFTPEEDEAELLELSDQYRPEVSRLSCQIELTADMDELEIQIIAPD